MDLRENMTPAQWALGNAYVRLTTARKLLRSTKKIPYSELCEARCIIHVKPSGKAKLANCRFMGPLPISVDLTALQNHHQPATGGGAENIQPDQVGSQTAQEQAHPSPAPTLAADPSVNHRSTESLALSDSEADFEHETLPPAMAPSMTITDISTQYASSTNKMVEMHANPLKNRQVFVMGHHAEPSGSCGQLQELQEADETTIDSQLAHHGNSNTIEGGVASSAGLPRADHDNTVYTSTTATGVHPETTSDIPFSQQVHSFMHHSSNGNDQASEAGGPQLPTHLALGKAKSFRQHRRTNAINDVDAMVKAVGGNVQEFHKEDARQTLERGMGLHRAATVAHKPDAAHNGAQRTFSQAKKQLRSGNVPPESEDAKKARESEQRKQHHRNMAAQKLNGTYNEQDQPSTSQHRMSSTDSEDPFANFSGFSPAAPELNHQNASADSRLGSDPIRRDFSLRAHEEPRVRQLISDIGPSRLSFSNSSRDSAVVEESMAFSERHRASAATAPITYESSPASRSSAMPARVDIPGFNNEQSYNAAVTSMNQLNGASPTQSSAAGTAASGGLCITPSITKKCNNAARKIVGSNFAALSSAAYEARADDRKKSAEIEQKITQRRENAEQGVEDAKAEARRPKTTPYPSELARLEEEARKERFRKKRPDFWW
ncbi:uncharacterized protein B0I36DRAFT_355541 [Microdochium trichocladiopsis]|uniref:Uncharacterized protein n=1 Tax=Microdochium trichocladiopsis TaxID=1682393 RepID=A0A9P8XRY5_9PEZI|nr:uncharacterized protein B0I36DRAFT_355541 [Microdochium trichocladiopsis]KAH7014302.1 hypothetical protein B0I36DRAFT_355541 [Microdochium trichocladiopsis]